MEADTVVQFRPYIAVVDVLYEMHLKTTTITLCFGPFNSKDAAMAWCNSLEQAHWVVAAREEAESEKALQQSKFFTAPFIQTHMDGFDVIQVGSEMRTNSGLILPGDVSVAARELSLYAVRASQEADKVALAYLEHMNNRT